MGLRCLLGHDFGPSGVVREHEEDGSEMVVTERELRRCRRCGEEQVLSESTEVRAIRMEDDVRPARRDDDAVAPASSTQGADVGEESAPFGEPESTGDDLESEATGDDLESEATPDTDALGDAAESVTGPESAGAATDAEAPGLGEDATAAADDDAESNTSLIERAEAGFDEPADPDDEDAVILDDGDEKPPREHGAWPDSGDGERSADQPGRDQSDAHDETTADDSALDPDSESDAGPVDSDPEDPRSLAERAAEEDAELLGGGPDAGADSGAAEESADTTESASESAWPAHDGSDEGFSAGAATAGGPGMAYGNELTPQSANGQRRQQNGQSDNGSQEYETSYLENTVEQRDGDGTIVSAGASGGQSPRPGAETEYYCPNCGHTRPLDSSLRTGDICPECQQGYIAERER